MRAELVGRGFSTIELVIALAILSVVLGTAVVASYSMSYWSESASVQNEVLALLQTDFRNLEARTGADFYATTATTTLSCGGMCYQHVVAVTDVSSCTKYTTVGISWKLPAYPTSTASLGSFLTNQAEAQNEGGDCAFSVPSGLWKAPAALGVVSLPSAPTALDVFDGVSYGALTQSPYFFIANQNATIPFQNGYTNTVPINAIDVAAQNGRVYAFLAAGTSSTPFQVLDVTDSQNPRLLASLPLSHVTATSSQANGWRVAYYGRNVYLTTRFISGFSPELHIFDVHNPAYPTEVAYFKLNTSVYGLIARDQEVAGVLHRFLYLATTASGGELQVLDVTNSGNPRVQSTCPLPGTQSAFALALAGSTLYVGRDAVPGGSELYAFDVSNPLTTTACPPLLAAANINTDSFSRHIEAVRVSGPYLFVATNNTTNAHGQIQIRNADPSTRFALISTYAVPHLIENGIDLDQNFLYALSSTSPQLTVLSSP